MVSSSCNSKSNVSNIKSHNMTNQANPIQASYDTITLGAGCYWCVEAVFQNLKGVEKISSGFMGGSVKNPSYREVCTGSTGHAEVCQIIFDPNIISLADLLEVFWTTHDPTTLNRQGHDSGTQYRSAIFYNNDNQKSIAEESKLNVGATLWSDPIVTEITKASVFYMADDYHQNYYNNNSDAPYCSIVISPKIAKVRQKFASKMK